MKTRIQKRGSVYVVQYFVILAGIDETVTLRNQWVDFKTCRTRAEARKVMEGLNA